MELSIIEEKKNRLVLEIVGEDHTLCNALRDELNNDKQVKVAGYNVAHPLTAHPKMIIETAATSNPKKALKEAVKRLKKTNESLEKGLKKIK